MRMGEIFKFYFTNRTPMWPLCQNGSWNFLCQSRLEQEEIFWFASFFFIRFLFFPRCVLFPLYRPSDRYLRSPRVQTHLNIYTYIFKYSIYINLRRTHVTYSPSIPKCSDCCCLVSPIHPFEQGLYVKSYQVRSWGTQTWRIWVFSTIINIKL